MSIWTGTIRLRPFRISPAGWLTGLVLALLAWQERAEQRYRLAELDDAMLKDLGLHRADVEQEMRKPFWQA
jgi:uncharacterized protein YjiS (DUF1127 family)